MRSEHSMREIDRRDRVRPAPAMCFAGVSRALAWSLIVVMALLLGTRAAAQPRDAMVLEGSEIAMLLRENGAVEIVEGDEVP